MKPKKFKIYNTFVNYRGKILDAIAFSHYLKLYILDISAYQISFKMHDKVERFLFKAVAEPIMIIMEASKNVAEAAYALVLIVDSQKGPLVASLFAAVGVVCSPIILPVALIAAIIAECSDDDPDK